MARPASIEDDVLIARLSGVFRDVGYEGASLAMLSDAAGLQRASLYHRFPGGKQQMAEEVLAAATSWAVAHVIGPLTREGDLSARLAAVRRALDEFYAAGEKSCLLNVLIAPRHLGGPFAAPIKTALEALIDAFARFAREAGLSAKESRAAGRRVMVLIQGGLVLARGLNDPKPFRDVLKSLDAELIPAGARA